MTTKISNKTLNVFNPATGKELESIKMTSPSELESILNIAKEQAFDYNLSSLFYRKKLIDQFRNGIVKSLNKFINIICNETGKKEFEALMEVFISLEHMLRASKHIYEALGKNTRRVGLLKTRKAWIEYEPLGVAGIISPWNYPLILTVCPLVESLLAGNSVVLKPSEHTPLTVSLLKKIWDASTQKNDLFQVVYGDADIGSAIVDSDLTDIICFTGSTSVGKKIAEMCAPKFKPVILELGGKDPMIVLEDADIERSTRAALWGGLSNAGQTCISIERIYVQEKIYSKMVDRLSKMIQNSSSGSGKTNIGSITIDSNLEKIKSHIENSRNYSQVIEGIKEDGRFIAPTLIIDPPQNSEILNQETFGPVMTIQPYKSKEEVINLANNTGYGLSASIFGKNKKTIKYIAKRLNVGAISINDVLTHYGIFDLPFGGIGLSGIGKVHGKEGLRAFSRQKAYSSIRIKLNSELWWYERSEKFGYFLKKWIKWYYR